MMIGLRIGLRDLRGIWGIVVGTFKCERSVCRCFLGNMEIVEGESVRDWEWMRRKGGCENVDGLGSEFANSSGVSLSELLN